MTSNDRHMNDTTMPPPSKGSPAAGAAGGGARARSKVALRKGFGLSDWTRLVQRSNDLAQRKGQPLRRIKLKEIEQHDSIHDGWVVIRGKVYFISPYLAYHPGGESVLKRVLGKDATEQYDKHHRWVNEDGLIGKLLIGYVDTSHDDDSDDEDEASPSYLPAATSTRKNDGFVVPTPRPPTKSTSTTNNNGSSENENDDEDEVSV